MEKRHYSITGVLIFLGFLCFMAGCHFFIEPSFRKQYTDYNSFVHENPVLPGFMKVHNKDGKVIVYDSWELTEGQDSLIGVGKLFDLRRKVISEGSISTSIDEIAIIETNQLHFFEDKTNSRVMGLSILAGVDALLGAICISVPKACFGSCPTFYLNETNNVHFADSEAFSSSISPSMEKHDIDALNTKVGVGELHLIMKNEALETHVVNEIQIITAEVERDEEILHGEDDKFFKVSTIKDCQLALTDKINITADVKTADKNEYFSLTDSTDLSAKEEILLHFNNEIKNTPGLVLNFRQTLLTTFLLYNGLSYMGDEVGDYFTQIETSNFVRKQLGNPFDMLGGIQVYIFNTQKNKWEFVSELYETGPIAFNRQIIPLPKSHLPDEKITVKLEMTRGMWRLDYAGLADIVQEIVPQFIYPSEIRKDNLPDPDALTEINCDDKDYLISMPGDIWDLYFDLPELSGQDKRYELFLYAKGYYLEWMRKDWLEAKDTERLKKMLLNDKATWHELAVEYKTYESQMEELFWNSKYEINQ